ncbi:MAG: GNAT family N-acetyltransferase [Anaerolineae bacterium]|nr:GNAT family N-acetyltransferase [Anaerolineae bacterium]
MTIRDFTPDDYPIIADIQTAIHPDTPAVPEDYIEYDARRDPKCKHQRWVVEVDGQVVAAGQYDQFVWMYHPLKFFVWVRVLPTFQRRGIGSVLWDHMSAALEPFEPAVLISNSRSDIPDGMRFLEKRGFIETHRARMSNLDIAAADLTPYAGLEDRLAAEGIVIKTCRELANDPERDRKLYDLEWILDQDVPGSEDLTRTTFERWKNDILDSENFLPDAYFVALDGDEYIGMSNLWADRASDMLFTGLTGVKRDYRRRGIATAMKARAVAYGKANNNSIIRTFNEVNNQNMLSINERLGFVKQPDVIQYEKTLRDGVTFCDDVDVSPGSSE